MTNAAQRQIEENARKAAADAFEQLKNYALLSGHDASVFDDPRYRSAAEAQLATMFSTEYLVGIEEGRKRELDSVAPAFSKHA